MGGYNIENNKQHCCNVGLGRPNTTLKKVRGRDPSRGYQDLQSPDGDKGCETSCLLASSSIRHAARAELTAMFPNTSKELPSLPTRLP